MATPRRHEPEALGDPEGFLEKLMEKGGPIAKKLLIAKIRPKAEPKLKRKGLVWEDVVPVLELVDSMEELQEAFCTVGYHMAIVGPLCTGPFPGPADGRLRSGRRQVHAGSLPIVAGSMLLNWNLKSIST